jgi:antitoxin component HigA of HigAB toxin-antitoxin module
MSAELNELLKEAYHSFKGREDAPLPIEMIKEYLEIEGIKIGEE